MAWRQLIEGWEAKLAGRSEVALSRYQAVMELARVRGFQYLDVNQISQLPVKDVVSRVEAVDQVKGVPDELAASALLGTSSKPKILVSVALELYWSLARDKIIGKSVDQVRRWRNPRVKAIRNFIAIVGDKPIEAITRDDMLDFRQHWLERIENGEVTANSANKDFIHLGTVLKTVNGMKRLNIDLPLGELSFREGEMRTRPPFSVDWIKSKLLAKGALDGLNPEARGLFWGWSTLGIGRQREPLLAPRPSIWAAKRTFDTGARCNPHFLKSGHIISGVIELSFG